MKNLIYQQCENLIDYSLPAISSISNLLALAYHELPHLNWIGLYLIQDDTKLCILGPFQGKLPALQFLLEKESLVLAQNLMI